ncbi:hypothetical protein EZJ19_06090 [Parasulfuritortus cantonensis]|uniref:Antifreeze protein n=1 Tax=Parasulfuritortus cantonensis TaxID=2528202 RepID=A0A4R1BF28_9PROT|nr:hypothetical protein [Parasulfuritortus cantonensis]TCJ15786.1 hypothetical protein EZJ19_06090 [Parasulfuritortus cantonensis]
MTPIRTASHLLGALLLVLSWSAAHAEDAAGPKPAPPQSNGVLAKVEHTLDVAATATAHGIQRGASATAHGVKRGAAAAARGIARGAEATDRAAHKVAAKITGTSASSKTAPDAK